MHVILQKFNTCINSLKICDPAVGSGHFLVSALNELISIKAEIGVLADKDGVRLNNCDVKIENDELIITLNDNTDIFEYTLNHNSVNKSTQRIQKTVFHEKEMLIENCLFGVDLNVNSAKICRLRLWIELLKHAYYTEDSEFLELETLPNIDINIKRGNSLINRFNLDSDLKLHLKNINTTIESYKSLVSQYQNATNKDERSNLESIIDNIKNDFSTHIGRDNKEQKKLDKLQRELNIKYNSAKLFDHTLTNAQKKDKAFLEKEVQRQVTKIKDVKNNKVFKNAFEWRIEFPQVLNGDGDFIGFDAIIGNPPYVFGGNEGISQEEKKYFSSEYITGKGKINLFTLFIERGFDLLKENGDFAYIIPNTFLRVTSYHEARKLLIKNRTVKVIKDEGDSVFEDAITTAVVVVAEKKSPPKNHSIKIIKETSEEPIEIWQTNIEKANYVIAINNDESVTNAMAKFTDETVPLGTLCKEMIFGVVITKNKNEVVSDVKQTNWKPFLEGRDIGPYYIKPIHSYLNYNSRLLHRARTPEIFENPEKILLQRITGGSRPLKAAYDTNMYYNKESINNIILNENIPYSYKYILALLNSKLINWFYTKQFTNDSLLTVNLSKEYLSQIPIAKASTNRQRAFSILVDYILSVNKTETNIDEYVSNSHICQHFEEVVDAMVFELYFKSEFETNKLQFAEHVIASVDPINSSSENSETKSIQTLYQQLRDKENIIRNNLKLMDVRLADLLMPIKMV